MSAVIRATTFLAAQWEGKPVPTVQILKVFRSPEGKTVVAQSLGVEAIATASDLAPDEFPLPVPATPPTPSSTTPSNSGAYVIGNGVSQPNLVRKVEPEY